MEDPLYEKRSSSRHHTHSPMLPTSGLWGFPLQGLMLLQSPPCLKGLEPSPSLTLQHEDHTARLLLPLLPLCSQEPSTSLFQFVQEERSMFVNSEGLSFKGTAQPMMRPHTLHGSCLCQLAE